MSLVRTAATKASTTSRWRATSRSGILAGSLNAAAGAAGELTGGSGRAADDRRDLFDRQAGANPRHFESFYHVLQFLSRRSKDDRWRVSLQQDFDEFGKRLKAVEQQDAYEIQKIRGIKSRIKRKLRSVMCGTERAYFVHDGQGAVDPQVTKTPTPQRDEIRDLKNVSRVIRLPEAGPAQVVDFWKSAPACLAFTGSHYRFDKALRGFDKALRGRRGSYTRPYRIASTSRHS
jgi:hypothetical protein